MFTVRYSVIVNETMSPPAGIADAKRTEISRIRTPLITVHTPIQPVDTTSKQLVPHFSFPPPVLLVWAPTPQGCWMSYAAAQPDTAEMHGMSIPDDDTFSR